MPQEFERQERDRAAEAEVRAQAAELRRLKADGMLGMLRSTASPRPQVRGWARARELVVLCVWGRVGWGVGGGGNPYAHS